MTVHDGYQIGQRLAVVAGPRDVFCTNDQLAVGVIRGLQSGGIEVPTDARVIGYGDLTLATEGESTLTTVAQLKTAMGTAAVDQVLAELTDGASYEHAAIVFTPRLIVGDSAPIPS